MVKSLRDAWRVGLPVDPEQSLRILQVNTSDIAGGAEKVAWNLLQTYRERGHTSWLAVGNKRSDDTDVLEIPYHRSSVSWARPCWLLHGRLSHFEGRVPGVRRLRYWLRTLAGGWPEIDWARGREDFNHPGSRQLLQLSPSRPDVVHVHNLHGNYFDLRLLPQLSHQTPLVLTLHDAWLLSGHCAHSFGCERWQSGCGQCPDLAIYPPIRRDATAYNWRRKNNIVRRSRLYIATPSQWLMDRLKQSSMHQAVVQTRVIPNGTNTPTFRPENQQLVRSKLRLPVDAKVLLFSANGIRRNPWKDYIMMREALARLSNSLPDMQLLFIALGEEGPPETIGRAQVTFVPYQQDARCVARYYQAADVYVHAAKVDTFPNTILEALACGTPVVATSVGGIPEQVDNGVTGFLVPPSDPYAMASAISRILTDDALHSQMGVCAAEQARLRFDLNRQADQYLAWYREILDCDSRSGYRN